METLECDKRTDPTDRLVRDLTAEETVKWLVEYHGLPKAAAETAISNIKEQYKWHRLRGRLDHAGPITSLIVYLLENRAPRKIA